MKLRLRHKVASAILVTYAIIGVVFAVVMFSLQATRLSYHRNQVTLLRIIAEAEREARERAL